ncbi:cytochrome P450 [Pseudoduganella plicata]|uniref:Cytochrome P450 n=2 Tax=Pseudoduganella plicata TaxID=321984 RepID=A0AA88C5B4_9BURK|nr:cytochrome P450 [Pseudoduganella plicata]GGY79264.1 cytochrome P450 [Pseudoduganella plicata]
MDRANLSPSVPPVMPPALLQPAVRLAADGPPPTRRVRDLPAPQGSPIIGNMRQLDGAYFHRTLENWARELGPLFRFTVLNRSMVVSSDRTALTALMRERPDLIRRGARTSAMMEEAITPGVFSAEGDDWRQQRKLVMRALTPEVVHNFFPTLAALTERLRLRWARAAAEGRRIDVLRDLKAWTLDVTIGLAMGHDSDTLQQEDNPLQRDIELVFARIASRLTTPVPYWRVFRLAVDRESDAAAQRISDAVAGFIAIARRKMEANPALRARPSNMLEALVAARDEPGSGFTDQAVIGNAITMVFAGEDTTSNTIGWLLDFLVRHPEQLAGVTREADGILGTGNVVQDHRLLDNMPYLDAAIREAMRLKPVAPFMILEPVADIVMDDTLIPAGMPIFTLLRHSFERENTLTNPELFQPERWLAQGTAGADDPARKLFPFGGGPRFCPGRYLAMAEMKMAMSMLAHGFTPLLDPAAPPVEERFTFTMTPSVLPVLLRPR